MASNNNDNSGVGVGIAFLFAGLYFLAMVVFAVALFIAVIFTILSLLALNKPLKLWGDHYLDPAEAKIFLISAGIGAVAVPIFAAFCAGLYGNTVPKEWVFYLVTGGYTFVPFVVLGYLEENEPEILHPIKAQVIDHVPELQQLPRPSPAPFSYASWDDEDQRK